VGRAIITVPDFEKVAEKLSKEYDHPPGICQVFYSQRCYYCFKNDTFSSPEIFLATIIHLSDYKTQS